MDDKWCVLCRDKVKQTTVKYGNKVLEVCNHCASIWVDPTYNLPK